MGDVRESARVVCFPAGAVSMLILVVDWLLGIGDMEG